MSAVLMTSTLGKIEEDGIGADPDGKYNTTSAVPGNMGKTVSEYKDMDQM